MLNYLGVRRRHNWKRESQSLEPINGLCCRSWSMHLGNLGNLQRFNSSFLVALFSKSKKNKRIDDGIKVVCRGAKVA